MAQAQESETLDVLGEGRLRLLQPRDGYRFSIDSLLLWGFLRPLPQSHWVDLGAGCGILAIALARIHGVGRVTALELQPSLVRLLQQNIRLNGVEGQVTVREGDLRDPRILEGIPPADGVCTNPPYYKIHAGRLNPNGEKAEARHEIRGTLEDFIRAGGRLLKRGGNFVTILPVSRFPEVPSLFTQARLSIAHLRFVHPYGDQPATHVLIHAVKEKQRALAVYPSFILYRSLHVYTSEAEALMRFKPLRYP